MARAAQLKPALGVVVDSRGRYGLRTLSSQYQVILTAVRGEKEGAIATWAWFIIKGLPVWFHLSSLDSMGKEMKWSIAPQRTWVSRNSRTWVVKASTDPQSFFVEIGGALAVIDHYQSRIPGPISSLGTDTVDLTTQDFNLGPSQELDDDLDTPRAQNDHTMRVADGEDDQDRKRKQVT